MSAAADRYAEIVDLSGGDRLLALKIGFAELLLTVGDPTADEYVRIVQDQISHSRDTRADFASVAGIPTDQLWPPLDGDYTLGQEDASEEVVTATLQTVEALCRWAAP